MTGMNDGPGIVDWTVTGSDSLSRAFGFAQGSAINFTGYTFLAQVRSERAGDAELLATLTVGTAAGTGVLTVTASTAAMALDAGGYWWELEWTTGSSRRTVLAGKFNVLPNTTRS